VSSVEVCLRNEVAIVLSRCTTGLCESGARSIAEREMRLNLRETIPDWAQVLLTEKKLAATACSELFHN